VKDTSGDAALLRFLARAGLLTSTIAQEIEADLSDDTGTPVIDRLTRKGLVGEEDLAMALAKGLRVPFVNLPALALDSAVTALVRKELAMQHQVIPLGVQDQTLTIATANPLDRGAMRAVEFATGKRVQLAVATQTGVRDALAHAYQLDDSLNAYLQGVPDEPEASLAEQQEEDATDVRDVLRESKQAPVVKLSNLILMEGLRTRASDIHVEAELSAVRVRYRIDGMLEESLRLPKWVQDPLVARFKVLAKLDITERRVPQDGRINVRYRESSIDLRVSSLPTQFGEKVTMRVLDASGAPKGLDRFDMPARDLKCIRHAITRPEGMILVTGPTGSGKSTTLYGMIAEVISPTRNIVTIENPIEYQIAGVNQVEINEKQGLTFAGTLRSILRQDPDVILVGEIRDAETAQIAMRAAQTGHLVLSTLHTNDAVATITRLIDLGIEPHVLASTLHLIIAQRLVRRVCTQCAEPDEPSPEELRALQIFGTDNQFRRGRGCSACRKTGYSGRVGVFEVLAITPQMVRLIETKATESAVRTQARADGTALLAMHAAARVSAGMTTAEEVLRAVDVESTGKHCPSCDRAVEDNFAVCPHCATPLQSNCTNCNKHLEKEWHICPYCSTPVKQPVATPSAPAPDIALERAPASPREYKVLVVDDHADIRRLVSFTLEHSGLPISVLTAADGNEALELAQSAPPDVILLDIMMPGKDGFEVCEQLRSNVKTAFIPILMVTARDDASSRTRGFLVGTDDYVAKPFERAELVARVRRIIERTYGAIAPIPAIVSAPAPEPAHDAPDLVLQ